MSPQALTGERGESCQRTRLLGRAVGRFVCLAAVSSLFLVACAPGGAHGTISQEKATAAALAAIVDLEREHAKSLSTMPVTGYEVVSARLTTQTASAADEQGHVLRVNPAPSQAWIVEITAPPQGIWGSFSALAEVDSSSGVVAGAGLWAIPANAPVKP
jgi:hypothetical protein